MEPDRVTSNQTLFAPFNWGGHHANCEYFSCSHLAFYPEYFTMLRVLMVGILFKSIFHHILLCGIADITHHVVTEGLYSLEFESKGACCFVSFRFWKEYNLSVVKLLSYRMASEPIARLLIAISRLLPVLSARPQIVSLCPAEVVPLPERSPYFDEGIQYPFRFDSFSLPRLMHQRWDYVFGIRWQRLFLTAAIFNHLPGRVPKSGLVHTDAWTK